MRSAKSIEDVQAELYHAGRLEELAAFAAALAHEVNQPLAAIANYAEAARQLAGSRAPEQMATIETVLARLDQQAARVAQIIRDLRAAIVHRRQAAVDRAVRPRAVLAPAVADALAVAAIGTPRATPGAPALEVALTLAPDLPAAAIDPVALQLVVFHLVRNAHEAMAGRQGRRALTVAARLSGGAIEVAVADTGPGVASPAALFRAFASTKPGGVGIGLALCKSIVEAHDGRLWYEPGVSGGAVFRFTVPIADAATNDADPAA